MMQIDQMGVIVATPVGLVFVPGAMIKDGKLVQIRKSANVSDDDPMGF